MRAYEIHQVSGSATTLRGTYLTEEKARAALEYLKTHDGKMPMGSGGVFELRGGRGEVLDSVTVAETAKAKAPTK